MYSSLVKLYLDGEEKPIGDGKRVGEIGNYYGSLQIIHLDGKYFWGIGDCNETLWQEIPEFLYEALVKFEEMKE